MDTTEATEQQHKGFPDGTSGKDLAYLPMQETDAGSIPGWEDPLEKKMATHSIILTWDEIEMKIAFAAAAKLLQLCPTLCDPIDSSPLGSSVPGILQARTGVGCHFLLQCMKVKSESDAATKT